MISCNCGFATLNWIKRERIESFNLSVKSTSLWDWERGSNCFKIPLLIAKIARLNLSSILKHYLISNFV